MTEIKVRNAIPPFCIIVHHFLHNLSASINPLMVVEKNLNKLNSRHDFGGDIFDKASQAYLWESKWGLCMADLRTRASGRMPFCGEVLGLVSESPLSSSTSPIALT